MEIRGFKENKTKWIISVIGGVLTLGLLTLFLTWKKQYKLKYTYDSCLLSEATCLLLKDQYGQIFEEFVVMSEGKKCFFNKEIKYVWSEEDISFLKLKPFDGGKRLLDFSFKEGLTDDQAISQRKMYGTNEIKVRVTPVSTLIIQEAANPFYFFQLYGLILWLAQEYFYYVGIVVSMSIISIAVTVYETRKQCKYLRDQVKVTGKVIVSRNNKGVEVPFQDLVPGDIVLLKEGGDPLPCDAVLLEGTCSVNESLLTGESVPITKVAVTEESELFSFEHHKRHILLGGTELMQVRGNDKNEIKALVIRTGFQSLKGEMVRSILYPKPVNMQFYTDFLRSVSILVCLGFVAFVYSTYVWIKNGASVADIVLNSLDLITFVVPALLPAAFTAGLGFAQNRLKKKDIYCLSSKYISLCGSVDVVCFDKTGTLTENDINVTGLVPAKNGRFLTPVSDLGTLDKDSDLTSALATCHSVVRYNDELQGNPADLAVFKASKWELLADGVYSETEFGFKPISVVGPSRSSEAQIGVLKQFPFESVHQRMSVITRKKGTKELNIAVKGAPERISQLCSSESVPSIFDEVVNFYAKQGYRMLAVAGRKLSKELTTTDVAQNMKREDLERDLVLYGLVVTQNQVKDVTYEAIQELQDADIKTLMITGDNLQTALFVAKDVQIIHEHEQIIQVVAEEVPASLKAAKHMKVTYIDPYDDIQMLGQRNASAFKAVHNTNYVFCLEGSSVDILYEQNPQLLKKILVRGRVFARMLPGQKVKLVEALQDIGHDVMMCGDGCNDCGALKAARAGISLSMADASIAAPFTSKKQDISCVPHLIKEGRATCTAGFCTFQFGTCVSLTSLAMIMLMYTVLTEPNDLQWVYLSYGHVLVPFLTLSNVSPWPILVKRRPQKRILAVLPVTTMVMFILTQIAVIVIGWTYCLSQPWFKPFVYVPNKRPSNASYEETVAWQLMLSSTIAGALALTPGPPYSKHIFTNKIFFVWFLFAVSLTTSAFFCRESGYVNDLNMKPAPYVEFSVVVYLLAFSNVVFCYLSERFVLRGLVHERFMPFLAKIRGPKVEYEKIEAEIKANPNWPPMGRKEESRYFDVPLVGETDEFDGFEDSDKEGAVEAPEEQVVEQNKKISSPAWNNLSFKTFRRSRRGAAYDITSAKDDKGNPSEEVPMYVVKEEREKEGERNSTVVMTTYKSLNVPDLPEEIQKRVEPLEEDTSDALLVNYRELNSSTPFLAASGDS